MIHISEVLEDMEALCERITGQTQAEWTEHYAGERRRAIMMATIKRGQNFTSNEMFGAYRDGDLLKSGWKQILGLDQDDILAVEIDVEQHELTPYEQFRQDKTRADSKAKFDPPTIRRVIRFQIASSVFG